MNTLRDQQTFPQLKPCQINLFLLSSFLKSCWCQSSEVYCDWLTSLNCCLSSVHLSPTSHPQPSETEVQYISKWLHFIHLYELKSTIYAAICFFSAFPLFIPFVPFKGQTDLKFDQCVLGKKPERVSQFESIQPGTVWMKAFIMTAGLGAAAAWRGFTLRASFTAFYNYCKPQYEGT